MKSIIDFQTTIDVNNNNGGWALLLSALYGGNSFRTC